MFFALKLKNIFFNSQFNPRIFLFFLGLYIELFLINFTFPLKYTFKETTTYFGPSTKEFMINYRVADLGYLVSEFKKNGVQILDSIEVVEYGKFLHILDLEGNKIELWEPNDIAFEKMALDMNLKTTY